MPHKERSSQDHDFAFTDTERLLYRVSAERFTQIFDHKYTTIHNFALDSNSYGEFLFVTVSYPSPEGQQVTTFYGLGLHENRDRWINDEWYWYEPINKPKHSPTRMDKSTANKLLEERKQIIENSAGEHIQSRHGEQFEILADLTDDDGAMAEMGDLFDL